MPRRAAGAGCVAALVLVVAACSSQTNGTGENAPIGGLSSVSSAGSGSASTGSAPTAFPSGPAASTGPSTSGSPSVPVTASTSTSPAASGLVARLEPRPAGARAWSGDWGATVEPSASEYVTRFYDAQYRADALRALESGGIQAIAHQTWIAVDANQIDIILMQFQTVAGAQGRYATINAATGARTDVTRFPIGTLPHAQAQGYREDKIDASGFVRARAYAHLPGSRIVVEAYFFSPDTFAKTDMLTWVQAQLKLLG